MKVKVSSRNRLAKNEVGASEPFQLGFNQINFILIVEMITAEIPSAFHSKCCGADRVVPSQRKPPYKRLCLEMRKVTSFQTRQSMGNKEICILVMHDDPIYRDIVAKMLQFCSHYEVLKRTLKDALGTIREKKDRLNLFVTDIHRSNTNGFEILQYIETEFKLEIMSMSPYGDTKLVPIGLTSNGNLYFLKSLSVDDFKSLWQYAYAKERGKTTSGQDSPLLDGNMVPSSLGNTSLIHEVAKRRESQEATEQNDATSNDSPNEKRQRVNWTDWMHQKFVEAIKELGPERAFPKKILELMDVPGLTRESVASHLQKYRLGMRRAEEAMQSTSSAIGSKLTTQLKQNCFSSIHLVQNFNSSQGRPPYLNQLPHSTSCPPGSIYSCLFHPEASTSTSNLGHGQLLSGTYPYGNSVSPFEGTRRNAENLYGFGTAQPNPQTGLGCLAQGDSGGVPGTQLKLNCEMGAIFPGIGNGRSSNSVSTYVGYRLSSNGKSVEAGQVFGLGDDGTAGGSGQRLACKGKSVETGQTFVSGDDVTAGGSGNESLVQIPLALGNHVPQQELSLSPVHPVGRDLEDLGTEGEVHLLLDATGNTSPQFYLNNDFLDAL